MEETTNTEATPDVVTPTEQNTAPESVNEKESPKEKNVGMAIVAYFIFFVPLLTDSKDDPFVKFHVKQGFVLFIGWIAVAFLSSVPFIMHLAWILNLGLLVLLVIGIMNVASNKKAPLPLIGQFADKFNF